MSHHSPEERPLLLSRVAGLGFGVSSTLWGLSALFAQSWWQSPGFQSKGAPLWLLGLVWLLAATVLFLMTFREVIAWVAVLALGLYSWATCTVAFSITYETLREGPVSAIGSAIAWWVLGLSAAARAWIWAVSD